MDIKAELNYVRLAPRKVRIVANLIKGMDVARAVRELEHTNRHSAGIIEKLLKSAIANAAENFKVRDGLYIKEIRVDSGPVLKRFRARAFGRSAPIRKRTSHVSIMLDTREALIEIPKDHMKKKKGPIIRDITEEEMKENLSPTRSKGKETKKDIDIGKKRPGIIRRMFQRKAI